jgi:hypothetical protein
MAAPRPVRWQSPGPVLEGTRDVYASRDAITSISTDTPFGKAAA